MGDCTSRFARDEAGEVISQTTDDETPMPNRACADDVVLKIHNGEGGDEQPGILSSMVSLPDRLRRWYASHEETLRMTLMTVTVVVISKGWDAYVSKELFPALLGLEPKENKKFPSLTCPQNFTKFWVIAIFVSVLLALTTGVKCARPGANQFMQVLPLTAAMLVGWSFKTALTSCHASAEAAEVRALVAVFGREKLLQWDMVTYEWSEAGELNSATSDFVFAVIATVGSALLIYAVKKLANKVTWGLDKLAKLLSVALALGVAATWQIGLDELTSLEDYGHFRFEHRNDGTLHDLPSIASLHIYFTFTTTVVLGTIEFKFLRERRRRATADLAAIVAKEEEYQLFCAERFINLRIRNLQRVWRMRTLMQAARKQQAKREPVATPSRPPKRDGGIEATLIRRAREQEAAQELQAWVMTTIHQHVGIAPHQRPINETLVIEIQRARSEVTAMVMELASKTLGFVVGWNCYDSLNSIFGIYRFLGNCSSCWASYVYLAFVSTLLSLTYILAFGKPSPPDKAKTEEEAEHLFVANALGLMQGWCWSDVVEACFRNLQKKVENDVTDQLIAASIATVLLTFFLIAFRAAVNYHSEALAARAYSKL